MRKWLCLATALCLLIAITAEGHGGSRNREKPAGKENGRHGSASAPGADPTLCRELQREVQEALGTSMPRGQMMRTIQRILRSAGTTTSNECGACVLREVARSTFAGDQAPCGLHDACVAGDALDPRSDACVADVCSVKRSCCRSAWDSRCVDLAVSICALDCDTCTHDACSEGRALPSTCGECETLVCKNDPFCCDTLWDARCVENALASCASPCVSTTTTTPSSTPGCGADADCADADACTVDACIGGACTSVPAVCEDADACTHDTCDVVSGCVFSPVSCDDGDPCTADSCDIVLGCAHSPIAGCIRCSDATPCNDGNLCTDDVCTASGTCSNPTNHASCEDGDLCTIGDSCVNGWCIGGSILDCNDRNACTVEACSAGVCNYFTPGCGDGNACTTDSCDSVTGCSHQAVSCDDLNACTIDSCDIVTGCAHQALSCDDFNPCTTDSCSTVSGCAHAAIAGCTPCTNASQCNDGNPCTDDVCSASGKCSHPTNRASCEDGNLCTTGDHCLNGSCLGGTMMNCSDGNACTVDACSAGTCTHFTPGCSDGNACTTDTCDAVTGCAHQTVSCDDNDPCTTDTCDLVQGCRNTPITSCGQ